MGKNGLINGKWDGIICWLIGKYKALHLLHNIYLKTTDGLKCCKGYHFKVIKYSWKCI